MDEFSEEQLIERAKASLSDCNWTLGECAALWTQKYARGRTDFDFGMMVGMSGDQIRQRRVVWETFSDVSDMYPNLKWSHFYVAVTWDDAADCLSWANEMEATVAEMKAWRRAQHGEDLSEPADEYEWISDPNPPRAATESDTTSAEVGSSYAANDRIDVAPDSRVAVADSAPRETEAAETITGTARQPTHLELSQEVYSRASISLEKIVMALSPEVVESFNDMPLDLQERVINAVKKLIQKTEGLM